MPPQIKSRLTARALRGLTSWALLVCSPCVVGQVVVDGGTTTVTSTQTAPSGVTVKNGTLVVGAGGTLVAGASSLVVGEVAGNVGTVRVEQGGTLKNGIATLGSAAGSTGSVTVTGTGSNWTSSSYVAVGDFGKGTVSVSQGAVVSSAGGRLGEGATGHGTVNFRGAGSGWNSSGGVFVGAANAGTFTLSEGGTLRVNNGAGIRTLGRDASASGTLNIEAPASASSAAGGFLNAATVTTGAGSGTIQFNTTGTEAAPYYFTKNGTSGGAAPVVAGSTHLVNTAGYNVLTGANTYIGTPGGFGTEETTVHNGTLVIDRGSIQHAGSGIVVGKNTGDQGALVIRNGGSVTSYDTWIDGFITSRMTGTMIVLPNIGRFAKRDLGCMA